MTAHRRQIVRFLVVGVVNTLFSYSVYAVLVRAGVDFALANLLSLVVGIFFSFFTQGRFVFVNTDRRRFGRFVLAWALIYGVGILFIDRFIAAGLNAYAAGALAVPVTSLLSYAAQKFFVYRVAGGAPADAGDGIAP